MLGHHIADRSIVVRVFVNRPRADRSGILKAVRAEPVSPMNCCVTPSSVAPPSAATNSGGGDAGDALLKASGRSCSVFACSAPRSSLPHSRTPLPLAPRYDFSRARNHRAAGRRRVEPSFGKNKAGFATCASSHGNEHRVSTSPGLPQSGAIQPFDRRARGDFRARPCTSTRAARSSASNRRNPRDTARCASSWRCAASRRRRTGRRSAAETRLESPRRRRPGTVPRSDAMDAKRRVEAARGHGGGHESCISEDQRQLSGFTGPTYSSCASRPEPAA